LSNDGRKVARHTVGGGRAIWIDDLDTGNQQRAVVGDNEGSDIFTFPIWTPDQNALVYSQGAPAPNLVYHRLGPQGGPSQLTRSERPQFAMSVSPDGRTLLYQEFGANTASDLWTLPLPSPPADIPAPVQGTPFLNSAASETQGRISPDGRFVTYISNTTGRYEVYVATFPSGAEHIQVSADGGFRPEWAPTGTELLFRTPRGWMMSATFHGQDQPRAGKPRILFDASKYENVFGVAPDGQRFLMMPLLPTEGAATEIRLVLNVLAEIRRRIPE
jgi:Tol biopolymer transport system component